ncbi:monocarboxylate transporter 14 [Patella vulgata]|uniref:monocarboxylate transporter 14 n=1 Tax=Patella vulgata TaxID=6465 RepID=UPI00218096B4|nr:monocarboxylate transporter 14 [Patella vulgata]XP_050414171.1 monocarboxylate transporter 14 [Patella vulgata]XP_050414179.1 monocarboxylate transporter 14 [Patella vulgata]XP_050414189.1 monocarboxylate transporter 14 [Patella vulgata]XP_050414198.1 monocarboxylate transporter 14 [Patella vulgata]
MAKKSDIDQGWAWVVLFAAFTSSALYAMEAVSQGIFQLEFLETFEGSRSYISLVCSIHLGLQLFLGIVASAICNAFSIRVAAMLGSILFSVGLLLSSFSTTFEELMLFYGVIAGGGSGIFYTSVSVITSHYFHKKRLLACGITFSSPGIGYICGPSFIRYLIESFGWRSALSILGCIVAQTCVLSALFFPVDETSNCCTALCIKKDTNQSSKSDKDGGVVNLPLLKKYNQKLKCDVPKENQSDVCASKVAGPSPTRQNNNMSKLGSMSELNNLHNSKESIPTVPNSPQENRSPTPHMNKSLSKNGFKNSVTSINSRNIHEYYSIMKDGSSMSVLKPENRFITSIQSLSSVSRRHLQASTGNLMWESHSSIQHLGTYLTEEEEREAGIVKEDSKKFSCKPDVSVLKNKALWCLSLSQLLLMFGYCINFIHYPSMIVSKGIDISVVPQLYMTQGVSLIVARLIGGLFCNHPDINILLISFGCQVLLGALVFCMPFLGANIWAYHLCQVFFAFYYGGTYVVLSQILIKLLGLRHLATGFGIQMMMSGIAFFITPTLAGWLYDITESYNLAYHCAGFVIFAGSFFVLMVQILEPMSFTNELSPELVVEIEEIKTDKDN